MKYVQSKVAPLAANPTTNEYHFPAVPSQSAASFSSFSSVSQSSSAPSCLSPSPHPSKRGVKDLFEDVVRNGVFSSVWRKWLNSNVDDNPIEVERSAKTLFVKRMIEECVAANEKLIVFSSFPDTLLFLSRLFPHWRRGRDFLIVTGTESSCRVEEEFLQPNVRVLFATSRECSIGLNLQCANRVLFVDLEYNPLYARQGIGRIHRFGQKKKCSAYILFAKGTTEERTLEKVKSKHQQSLLIDDVRSSAIDEALRDVLSPVLDIPFSSTSDQSEFLSTAAEDSLLQRVCGVGDLQSDVVSLCRYDGDPREAALGEETLHELVDFYRERVDSLSSSVCDRILKFRNKKSLREAAPSQDSVLLSLSVPLALSASSRSASAAEDQSRLAAESEAQDPAVDDDDEDEIISISDDEEPT